MSDAIKQESDYQFTAGRQTVWGTALTATGTRIPCTDMVFTPGITEHRIKRAIGIRGDHEDTHWTEITSKPCGVKFSFPATPQMLGLLLPGILQAKTAYAAATNVWTMHTHGSHADWPNVNDTTPDNGYFYTFTQNDPVAASSVQVKNAICTSWTFKHDLLADDGIIMCDTEWIAQGYARAQAVITSITADTGSFYKWSAMAATNGFAYDTLDLTAGVQSYEITLKNGAQYCFDSGSKPAKWKGWDDGGVSGKFVVGDQVVGTPANVETMKGYALARAVSLAKILKMDFGDGTSDPNAAGELLFTTDCYLNSFDPDKVNGVTTFGFAGDFGAASAVPFEAKFYL